MKPWLQQTANVLPFPKKDEIFFRKPFVHVPFNAVLPQMIHSDDFFDILPQLYLISPDYDLETLPFPDLE